MAQGNNVILFPRPRMPFQNLQGCMKLRDKYEEISLQRPGDNPNDGELSRDFTRSSLTFTLGDDGVDDGAYDGVYLVSGDGYDAPNIPEIKEYYTDLRYVTAINGDGLTKSVVGRRLKYLSDKFDKHLSKKEAGELNAIKDNYRDLSSIYKVDTHVHHTACMSLHRLTDFVTKKIKGTDTEDPPLSEGEKKAVKDAAKHLKCVERVSIDAMDMLAYRDSFHRFDNFNKKYSPAGQKKLKSLFLKHDNGFNGRFLAQLTRAVMDDLTYECCEWRISVGGDSIDDWNELAWWINNHKLYSNKVRWLIQVPRRDHSGKTFEEIVHNIFQPLFEATKCPEDHPLLHQFLEKVVGFDSVDDESKVEHRVGMEPPKPKDWKMESVPPYSYWVYYMYANIASLNHWRKKRNFNTFVFRPHSGEAGDAEHVAAAFLTSQGIAHGITLRDSPVLLYLYYLKQIGIAMSPISNNALFLKYEDNPLPNFFKVGLNVSLSTDDPLLFHFTQNPLLEEYSVATHIFKFSQPSLAELARNSVVQSGFELKYKNRWLGTNWKVKNDIHYTNVPDERIKYRRDTLEFEWEHVRREEAVEKVKAKCEAEAERRGEAGRRAEVGRKEVAKSREEAESRVKAKRNMEDELKVEAKRKVEAKSKAEEERREEEEHRVKF